MPTSRKGRLPGAVIAIARKGKLVYYEAFGFRDKAAGVAMTKDTIFNIASMTKPMVALAALQLHERGKLLIDDPLAKYFPKFAEMQVAELDASGETITGKVPATRPITLRHLMLHTSGLIYGGRGNTAVHKLYPGGSGAAGDHDDRRANSSTKLATLPLLYQPGAVWDYGFGLDVLGLVVEKVSGQTLGQYFAGEHLQAARHDRHRLLHPAGEGRALRQGAADRSRHRRAAERHAGADAAAEVRMRRRRACHPRPSDYMRFALMLLNKGALWRDAHPRPQDRRIHADQPAWARR